jgi:hypothetical protein
MPKGIFCAICDKHRRVRYGAWETDKSEPLVPGGTACYKCHCDLLAPIRIQLSRENRTLTEEEREKILSDHRACC